ncbi:MAG TPA: glycosyltransferase family 4 protein [Acidimicrobiales bacterium]|nr:glycosyltransferase family 4 protein [Acidimicrobiales bacterium]
MRVALHCPYSLSRPGGVQGQVLGLARALRARGHEAVVLAPADADAASTAPGVGLDPAALVVVGRGVPVPANGSVAPVALWPGAAVRAARAVAAGHFDVVHLHEPLAPGDGYGVLLAGAGPKVGTFHRAGGSAAYRLFRVPARHALARLAVRAAVSAEAEATVREALGGEYVIVPNAVELERYDTARPWPEEGSPDGVVLFVGRHEQRKGLEVLLEAFGRLAPGDHGGPRLWVAGDGPATAELRRRFPPADRIAWLGVVPDDELAARLAAADVLCAPSLYGESFGVVLLEAMAARTAIVASDLPGYAAVAGDVARLVPPGNVDALAEALGAALGEARRGTGASAPEALDRAARAAARWSMTAQAARYLELYEEAIGRTGAGTLAR